MKEHKDRRVHLHPFLMSALYEDTWLNSRPDRFTPACALQQVCTFHTREKPLDLTGHDARMVQPVAQSPQAGLRYRDSFRTVHVTKLI